MLIIGVDYHPSFQQIAFVNTDTGECGERRLVHSTGENEIEKIGWAPPIPSLMTTRSMFVMEGLRDQF